MYGRAPGTYSKNKLSVLIFPIFPRNTYGRIVIVFFAEDLFEMFCDFGLVICNECETVSVMRSERVVQKGIEELM